MRKIIYTILLLVVFLPVVVTAHGTGQAFTVDKDGYQIDIDLDTKQPKSNTGIRFDFDLLDPDNQGLETDFDYIWVRIQQGQKTIFAGGLGKPDFGPMGFTTTLPDPGVYTLSLRFQNEGETVVEGETNFSIAPGEDNEGGFISYLFSSQTLAGLLVGLILSFLFATFFRKK